MVNKLTSALEYKYHEPFIISMHNVQAFFSSEMSMYGKVQECVSALMGSELTQSVFDAE